MFKGCGTALVTPFREDLSLDEEALRTLVRRQIDAGIDFLVPCGTTGESPTLTHQEHLRVVAITIEESAGKVPVLAGAGGYDTAHVMHLAREIEALGADGILSVTPYYNRPTQEGLLQHYTAIAASTSLPIIVYNVPSRTGTNVEPATLVRLADIPNITGAKEASGNLAQQSRIVREVPQDFAVLSGDDILTLPLLGLGGHGVISVVSNLIPGDMTALSRAGTSGDFAEARRIHHKYTPLMDACFVESNPGPVKYALAKMGLIRPAYRLPMVIPSATNQAKIDLALREAGLVVS
jgi:4-hydroxy-tetrahydrodipicolinate synthase